MANHTKQYRFICTDRHFTSIFIAEFPSDKEANKHAHTMATRLTTPPVLTYWNGETETTEERKPIPIQFHTVRVYRIPGHNPVARWEDYGRKDALSHELSLLSHMGLYVSHTQPPPT